MQVPWSVSVTLRVFSNCIDRISMIMVIYRSSTARESRLTQWQMNSCVNNQWYSALSCKFRLNWLINWSKFASRLMVNIDRESGIHCIGMKQLLLTMEADKVGTGIQFELTIILLVSCYVHYTRLEHQYFSFFSHKNEQNT